MGKKYYAYGTYAENGKLYTASGEEIRDKDRYYAAIKARIEEKKEKSKEINRYIVYNEAKTKVETKKDVCIKTAINKKLVGKEAEDKYLEKCKENYSKGIIPKGYGTYEKNGILYNKYDKVIEKPEKYYETCRKNWRKEHKFDD